MAKRGAAEERVHDGAGKHESASPTRKRPTTGNPNVPLLLDCSTGAGRSGIGFSPSRRPADEIGFFMGKDANATSFPGRPKSIGKRT